MKSFTVTPLTWATLPMATLEKGEATKVALNSVMSVPCFTCISMVSFKMKPFTAGVNSSKVIVVINKDAEAPFFKAADYGIVGDVFDVLPKLTKAVKELK